MPKVINEEIIEIDGEKFKVKTFSNGAVVKSTYSDEPYIPKPEEPTDEEIFQAEILLNQMQIIATQEAQDEVLAEILLNQN